MTGAGETITYDSDEISSITLTATEVRRRWYELLHRVEAEGLWVFITHHGVDHRGERIAVLLPYGCAPSLGVTVVRQLSPHGDRSIPIASLLGVSNARTTPRITPRK